MANSTSEEHPKKKAKHNLKVPTFELIPGVPIPVLGFGVGTSFFKGKRGEDLTIQAVTAALNSGLLHIDEAEMYENEAITGRALHAWLARPDTSRASLFVTGKVLGSIDGLPGWCECLEASCRNSIAQLGIEYFDLYLVHAPFHRGDGNPPFKRSLVEVWREMEALVAKGFAKAIGVSNWRVKDLKEVCSSANIKPCINQIENHPHLRQPALIDYCNSQGIAVASYGGLKPLTDKELGQQRLMQEIVPRIAAAHGKTHAQILQRWNFQSPPAGRKVVISTTAHDPRLKEYMDVFDGAWELSSTDMAAMDEAGDECVTRKFWNSKLDED